MHFINQISYLIVTPLIIFITAIFLLSSIEQTWFFFTALMFFCFITPRYQCFETSLEIVVVSIIIVLLYFLFHWIHPILPAVICTALLIMSIFVFVGYQYPKYYFLSLLINLFVLVFAFFLPQSNHIESNAISMVYGALLILLLRIIFWPYFSRSETTFFFRKAIRVLKTLQDEIYACFLQAEYVDSEYLFERRIHSEKRRFALCIEKLKEVDDKNTMLIKLENIYALLLDAAQLRRRVSDHTIFELCQHELKSLLIALDHLFLTLERSITTSQCLDQDFLTREINQLESMFQSILQVTAREPIIFLLFIYHLKVLREEIKGWPNLIWSYDD